MAKLIEFSVSNYRSIAEKQTISLIPASNHKEYSSNILYEKNRACLNAIVIYGANSSGKSNILAAMGTMKKIVRNSGKFNSTDSLPFDPFLLREGYSDLGTLFEIVLAIDDLRYRYGFTYNKDKILEEWLFRKGNSRETPVFSRRDEIIETYPQLNVKKGIEDMAIEATKDNSLFLTVCDMFNVEIAKTIMEAMIYVIVIKGHKIDQFKQGTFWMMERENYMREISGYLSSLNLGIEDISVEKDDTNDFNSISKLKSKHIIFDSNARKTDKYLEWDWESHESSGSTKALIMSGPVLWILERGGTLVVDEIEAYMHPIMTLKTIELFLDKKSNPNGAQIIFTTHDTNLLSYAKLRRDQICFMEKNSWEASELFSLSDFKYIGEKEGIAFSESERPDTDKEKRYFEGRYGAVPMLGKFNDYMKDQIWQEAGK